MPRRRSGREPRQGEVLLDGLFRRLGLGDEARGWRAVAAWATAAGPRIAARARGERMRGGTLIVRVASSAWAHELGYLKATLLERLHAVPGGEGVEDVRFIVGPLADAPDFAVDDRPAPVPAPRRPPPPPLDGAAIAEAVAAVRDPEIRAALGELLSTVARAR